jgi:predicted HAD superfamily phosphohydrolase
VVAANGTGAGPKRLFVTDCEGPLSRNDNAQELAARFIPDGAEFFARLSRYDDVLADVERRPGYNAGDTLRLLPPFLLAFEVNDEEIEEFSAENVVLVPQALKVIDTVRPLLPSYVISTSYTPYIRALCEVARFPCERTRSTELRLADWRMTADEKAWLRDQLPRVLRRPVIDIPDGAASLADLSPSDRHTVEDLDHLFWDETAGKVAGRIVATVRPVGGGMKLAALREIAAAEVRAAAAAGAATAAGARATNDARLHEPLAHEPLAHVMYVGDSITDVPPLRAVREAGGVALSFNGNAYALAAAEFAAASADALPIAHLARAFARGGREAVLHEIRAWPKPKKGVSPTGRAAAAVGVLAEAGDALAEASRKARREVRVPPPRLG